MMNTFVGAVPRGQLLVLLLLVSGIFANVGAKAQPAEGHKDSLIESLMRNDSDPATIAGFEKRADRLVTATASSLVRNIPVAHPETGQIVPFEVLCRDLLERVGGSALEGSDLQRDPVGTVLLLLLDTDAFLEARLIKTESGWISVQDAARRSLGGSSQALMERYGAMQRAYRQQEPQALARATFGFYRQLKAVNTGTGPQNQRASGEASVDERPATTETGSQGPPEGTKNDSSFCAEASARINRVDGGVIEAQESVSGCLRAGTRVDILNDDKESIAEGVVTSRTPGHVTIELLQTDSAFYQHEPVTVRVMPDQEVR
jgi:hypothetical protein